MKLLRSEWGRRALSRGNRGTGTVFLPLRFRAASVSLPDDMRPLRRFSGFSVVGLVLLMLPALGGCKRSSVTEEGSAPPPPAPSARPGACTNGGGKISDGVSSAFFPQTIGSYCIDPNGETRAYGAQSAAPLDKVCIEQFDGECEVYKSYGLDRVVTLRYIDGAGTQGEVSVVLGRFTTKEGAYGFYTKRVVGGQDPNAVTSAPLAAGGEAALGTGISYVWRGLYVAQLAYTNIDQSPTDLAKSSAEVLPSQSEAIGRLLPGDVEPPRAVLPLPKEDRVKLGVSYVYGDLFGVEGVGAGALGFYKAEEKRWRIASLIRPDEDSAKDVMKSLVKQRGAKGEKNAPYDLLHFSVQADESSPRASWWIGRKGTRILALGDEDYVLAADKSKDDLAKVSLDDAEKKRRLMALLSNTSSAPAPSSSAP